MKTKHPVHVYGVWGFTSDGDAFPSFILPRGLTLNSEAYIKYLDRRGGCWKTRAEEPSLACKKISASISPLTSRRQTPQIVILLIIVRGAWFSERPRKLYATPKLY